MNAGAGDWEDAYTKARAMVAQMTDEEKNNVCRTDSDRLFLY